MTELSRYDLAFCVRRLPRDVKDMLKREGRKLFVAGGFIRSVIANEHINDVDLFTATPEDADRLAHQLAGDRKPYQTENAFTVTCRKITVQFISRWSFTLPEYALESFDFTIAKAALWWDDLTHRWDSACDDTFYADLAARRLVYTCPQRNEDAGGSILRVLKFYQRGYRIPLESMGAVIARLCKGINFTDPLVRKESGLARVITGLLREVDPLVDPDAEGHVDSVGRPQDVAAEGDPADYSQHGDCGNCGKEAVWLNGAGHCKDCVDIRVNASEPPECPICGKVKLSRQCNGCGYGDADAGVDAECPI